MKISWVTIDRFCQEEADDKEDVRRELERTGRPLRSSADPLSDYELLAKLRDIGVDVDRDGVERLCVGALSAEEVARPIVDKLELDDMTVDWVWISLLALWQRWWPDRACLELLELAEKAEGPFGSWLDADPGWGWGWIGWADCFGVSRRTASAGRGDDGHCPRRRSPAP